MGAYDHIIVGAGSAGCVLANRLSEDAGCEVLLIEAGGRDRSAKIKIPAAFAQQFNTDLDWAYYAEPEPGCEQRRLFIPRGRCLGGSSSMNAMLYVRGCAADYDGWAAAGCEGWGWEDVLPYFTRSENRVAVGGAPGAHGTGGELDVCDLQSPSPLTGRLIDAARARDFPLDPDYNDGEPDGVTPVVATQRRGRRWSAADAFLRPAMKRPNLTVATNATALGVELDGERATGVRYADRRGRARLASVRGEVILAAGAIASPQLLQLSGIGPAEVLRSAGVEPRIELAGVGSNLQDHPYLTCIWDSTVGDSLLDAEKPAAMLRWLLRRTGPLSSPVAEAFVFTRSRPELTAPDLQLHFAPAYFNQHGVDEYDRHAFTVGPVLIAPRSRGRVRVRSADPIAHPSILGNHLTEPEDVAAMVAGVELARELAATEPLAAAAGREIFPGPEARTGEEVEAAVRHRVELLYHPVGTCRMGTDDEAVLDPDLRVRGVEGLRVIDASVMPTITRGNTNAPTYMIAERGADLIRGRSTPAPAPGS